MFFFIDLFLELLNWGFDTLRVIEKECLLLLQFIQNSVVALGLVLSDQNSFLIDVNNGASISTVKLSNILELLFGYLFCWFKLALHFGLNFIPFNFENIFGFF